MKINFENEKSLDEIIEKIKNKEKVLIAFIGRIGSGKTFISKNLMDYFKEDKKFSFISKISLSDSLKEFIFDNFGFYKEGRIQKKELNFEEFKKILRKTIKFEEEEDLKKSYEIYKMTYYSLDDYSYKKNFRYFIQNIGTDIFRKKDENFWIKKFIDKINNINSNRFLILIDDLRFKNEYDIIKKYCNIKDISFILIDVYAREKIRMKRRNLNKDDLLEIEKHSSETDYKYLRKNADFLIINEIV